MKTSYKKVSANPIKLFLAVILFMLVLSNTARSQTSNSPVCDGQAINLFCAPLNGCGIPGAIYTWTSASGWSSTEKDPVILPGTAGYGPGHFYLSIQYPPNGLSAGSVSVTTTQLLVAGSISANQTICAGNTPALLTGVAPSNGTARTYQWQSSTDNLSFGNIPGATNLNYQPGVLNATMYYRQMQNATGVCGGPLATNTVTVTVSPAMVISDVHVSDVSCNGGHEGAISMTVTGSTPPYTYVWSNGSITPNISQLYAGNYSVTGTSSSGCFTVGTWEVKEPLPILLSYTIISDCSVGSINLTVSGGTFPYFYLWDYQNKTSKDLTNVPAGTYTVVVTDSHGCQNSVTITVTTLICDFGDAPQPTYPTTLATYNGARHVISAGFKLGIEIDAENEGQPSAQATDDDKKPISGPDDEDGVTVPQLHAGSQTNIDVYTINSKAGWLQGWIDFDGNGWDNMNSGDKVIYNFFIPAGTKYTQIPFQVPTSAQPRQTVARFRLSTVTDLDVTGLAPDGEVEDMFVQILPPVNPGPDPGNDTICIGDTIRLDTMAIGLGYPPNTLPGGYPYVYHWTSIPWGFNSYLKNPIAAPGLPTTYHLLITDAAGNVASGVTHAVPDSCDFGDAPESKTNYPTKILPDNGARHLKKLNGVWLGDKIDYEMDGQPNNSALGDDIGPPLADEDGVIIPDDLLPCVIGPQICMRVIAHGPGYLNAWVDFDLNTSWIPSEQIFSNLPLTTGDNHLIFNIPAWAKTKCNTFARFRFTADKITLGFIPPTGQWDDGEVEDYEIYIPSYTGDGSIVTRKRRSNVTCYGGYDGAVELSVTGGVSPYSFLWNNGATTQNLTGLQAGQYAVAVTDFNGETVHDSVTIYQFLPQTAEAGPDQLNIPDTMITLQGSRPGNGSGTWSIVNGSGGIIEDVNDPLSNFYGIVGQNYLLSWTISDECGSSTDNTGITFVYFGKDYGDAPEPKYHTTNSLNGPCHLAVGTRILGTQIDAEPNGQPDGTATGDDSNGATPNDEKGVVIPPLIGGQMNTITVTTKSVLTPGCSTFLQGWIDFNCNGIWTDQGEQIFTNYPIYGNNSPVTFTYNIYVPSSTGNVGSFARFRISSAQNLGPDGCSNTDGEVEDYMVQIMDSVDYDTICEGSPIPLTAVITGGVSPYSFMWSSNPPGFVSEIQNPTVCPSTSTTYTLKRTDAVGQVKYFAQRKVIFPCDYGDLPDDTTNIFDFQTLIASNGARHIVNPEIKLGTHIHAEANGVPKPMADGDDYNTPVDDEDGITQGGHQVYSLLKGNNYIEVTASITGRLSAWVDLDQNHILNNTNERVWTNLVVSPSGTYTLNIPATALNGNTYARFRFTKDPVGTPIPYGMEMNGEVEDYWVRIGDTLCPPDLWAQDHPDDLGYEPNTITSGGDLYQSEDIWVRNFNVDPSVWNQIHLPHENPEYTAYPPPHDYVHVQIRNKGCKPSSIFDNVTLYWAKASTALSWEDPWKGGGAPYLGHPMGGIIGVIPIPPIQPGESVYLNHSWDPPNPADYTGDPNMSMDHFCFLARIEPGITFSEGSVLWQNVANNNNIVWKNVIVVDNVANKKNGFVIGNKLNVPLSQKLFFIVPPGEESNSIFHAATVKVKLQDSLYKIWKLGGKQGNNVVEFEDSTLQLMANGAYITNLNLGPNSTFAVSIDFDRNAVPYDTLQILADYRLNVQQSAAGSMVVEGGIQFLINQCFLHPPDILVNQKNVSCSGGNDGRLSVTISGGKTPYTFMWSNGAASQNISGLSTGNYTVTVTDATGCTNTASQNIVVGPPVVAGVTITASANQVCSGSMATFTAHPVNGGIILPTYQWRVNGINAGSNMPVFSYFPSDGDMVSCIMTSTHPCVTGNPATSNILTMTVNPLPVPVISGPGSVNVNSTGNVYTTGAGMQKYGWTVSAGGTITSGAGTNAIVVSWTTAGAKVVTVSYSNPNGCGNTGSKTVTVIPVIPTSLTLANATITNGQSMCYNATQTITVAGNGSTFTVVNGGSATLIGGIAIVIWPITHIEPGGYFHAYIAPTGPWCGTKSASIMAVPQTEPDPYPVQEKSFFTVYPNPTTGGFSLELKGLEETAELKVEMYGMLGDRVFSAALHGQRKYDLTLDGKPVGVYFIRVVSGKLAGTGKIIKQ